MQNSNNVIIKRPKQPAKLLPKPVAAAAAVNVNSLDTTTVHVPAISTLLIKTVKGGNKPRSKSGKSVKQQQQPPVIHKSEEEAIKPIELETSSLLVIASNPSVKHRAIRPKPVASNL